MIPLFQNNSLLIDPTSNLPTLLCMNKKNFHDSNEFFSIV